jgi:hypothetical protein
MLLNLFTYKYVYFLFYKLELYIFKVISPQFPLGKILIRCLHNVRNWGIKQQFVFNNLSYPVNVRTYLIHF